MENKDYMDLIKFHIEQDKTLYKTKPEYRETVKSLLEKKQQIIQQNSLFAGFKLNRINKKIQKYLK